MMDCLRRSLRTKQETTVFLSKASPQQYLVYCTCIVFCISKRRQLCRRVIAIDANTNRIAQICTFTGWLGHDEGCLPSVENRRESLSLFSWFCRLIIPEFWRKL